MLSANRTDDPSTLTGGNKSRILIVDDHPLVRQGIAQLVNLQADLQVCGEAGNADEATEAIRNCRPDLVIVDISLEGISGIELIKIIKAKNAHLPMLVMSMHDESLYAERALRAGARGYIMKQETPATILAAIRQILRGDIHVSDKMRSKMLQRMIDGHPGTAASPMADLSDRELEVLRLIGQGFGTTEIATKMSRSIKTIEAHRANLKQKLQLKTGAELVRHAIQWVGLAD